MTRSSGSAFYTSPALGTRNGARHSRVNIATAAGLSGSFHSCPSIFNIGPNDIGVFVRSTPLAVRCLIVRCRQSATSSLVLNAANVLPICSTDAGWPR